MPVLTGPLPTPGQVEAELCRRRLRDFVRAAWHVIEANNRFVSGWHIDAVCDHLQAVSSGHLRNLLINIPPRHAKSLCVSVFWMCWSWASRPQTRWLYSAYTSRLSIRDSDRCRKLIGSSWFQSRWGGAFRLSDEPNTLTRFANDHSGSRIATGVQGSNTGEGGDVVVVDDPHNVNERDSDKRMSRTLLWWDEVMSTRLNDPKTGAKVIVMQRVSDQDLSGHVLAQGGYEHLCLPVEHEPGRHCITTLGWADPRKADGELLWPARFGLKEVADLKVSLGPMGYAAQFQQRPAPAGGGRFKRDWFRYFTVEADSYLLHCRDGEPLRVERSKCDRFGMMDPATTRSSGNRRGSGDPCYTVIGVWDVTPGGDMIKVHHFRGQLEAPQVAEKAIEITRGYDLPWLGIEKNGIGDGILQTIRARGCTVLSIPARGSKEARSETAEIRMAAGKIYFPRDAAWLWDMQHELLTWPNSQHSDQVDELAHAAMWVQKRMGAVGATPATDNGDAADEKWIEDAGVWRDVHSRS